MKYPWAFLASNQASCTWNCTGHVNWIISTFTGLYTLILLFTASVYNTVTSEHITVIILGGGGLNIQVFGVSILGERNSFLITAPDYRFNTARQSGTQPSQCWGKFRPLNVYKRKVHLSFEWLHCVLFLTEGTSHGGTSLPPKHTHQYLLGPSQRPRGLHRSQACPNSTQQTTTTLTGASGKKR